MNKSDEMNLAVFGALPVSYEDKAFCSRCLASSTLLAGVYGIPGANERVPDAVKIINLTDLVFQATGVNIETHTFQGIDIQLGGMLCLLYTYSTKKSVKYFKALSSIASRGILMSLLSTTIETANEAYHKELENKNGQND